MNNAYDLKPRACFVWRPRHGNYNTFKSVKLALKYISAGSYSLSDLPDSGRPDKDAKFNGLNCHDDLNEKKLLAPVQINIPNNLPAIIFKESEEFIGSRNITRTDYPGNY